MPKISVRVDDDDDERGQPAKLGGGQSSLSYDQKVDEARRMVTENSKQVAQVVRNWVGEDGN